MDYGARTQWETNKIPEPILPPKVIKYIQEVIRKYLFYARELYSTIMVALGTLVVSQLHGTSEKISFI